MIGKQTCEESDSAVQIQGLVTLMRIQTTHHGVS